MQTNDFQKTSPFGQESPVAGAGPWLLAAREELGSKQTRVLRDFQIRDTRFEVRQGKQSLWLVARPPAGGGFAFRLAWAPDGMRPAHIRDVGGAMEFGAESTMGRLRGRLQILNETDPLIRWTVTLTPVEDLVIPFWPRDVYPLDENEDPMETGGTVHAAQRNTCGGLLYLSLTRPRSGSLLYIQDLSSLNDYCIATGTVPDTVVGGQWPELGFSLPPTLEGRPLPKDGEVGISDAIIRFSDVVPENDRQCARLFFDLLAEVYPHLTRPETQYHDWPKRAEKTIHDLSTSPLVTTRQKGHLYVKPYVDAEDPDSMTQLNVVKDMRVFGRWLGKEIPFAEELRKSIPQFYRKDPGTMFRYLPWNEGLPGNMEGDSWYMYVTLGSLAFMARNDDDGARQMFLDSLPYAMKVARRFEYRFPVQFDPKTLEVVKGSRKPGDPGESDVGGLYAHVMMEAYGLTHDVQYIREAEKSIRAMDGYGFNIGYQFNLTAWAALGALEVWKATDDVFYKEQSYVLLASFFHNTFLWTSRLGAAAYFPSFLGLSCLHDGKYKATYEEHDAFTALHEYINLGGSSIAPSVRLFVTEYFRHMLDQVWYTYPSELPKDQIADETKNGRIERDMAVPLEDLYVGWEKPGQVGQEVYGAGAPMAFTSRCWHRMPGLAFMLFCDVPIAGLERPFEGRVTLNIVGTAGYPSRVRLIPLPRKSLPDVRVTMRCGGERSEIEGAATREGHLEYHPSPECELTIEWQPGRS
jgi:hypothetical protein